MPSEPSIHDRTEAGAAGCGRSDQVEQEDRARPCRSAVDADGAVIATPDILLESMAQGSHEPSAEESRNGHGNFNQR
jgi:hypothetical protein